MFKKYTALLLIAAFLVTGCGYRMVITGKKAVFTVYPELIRNSTPNIEITSVLTDSVKMYLATIGALAEKGKADYIGEFDLTEMKIAGASNSSSLAMVNLRMKITLKDKKGETVYSRVHRANQNYSNSSNMTESKENREEAITQAVNKVLSDFANAFSK